MISRLLLRHQSVLQLLLAIVGALAGLFVLLMSLQAYLDFKNLLEKKSDLINPQYIIVNKKVSLLNTIAFSNSTFSDSEIEGLKNVKSIERVGKFNSNLFAAQAYVDKNDEKNIPGFYTDLFFESVADDFIDVKSDRWKWTPGDSVIPIIIPADYLNLYNFGFAPSQDLPQISKKTVEAVEFKVKIHGADTSANVYARVAGFSDRINSFLVPESFLTYANQIFGVKKSKGPSRLIIVSSDPTSPDLTKYLNDNGYETSAENLKNSKLSLVLRIIMNILAAIGGLIILLSLLGFIQYSQLMISKSKYEIQTLIQLGYYHLTIFRKYFVFYILLFSSILVVTFALLITVKSFFMSFMLRNGFEIDPGLSATVILTGFGIFILLVLINAVSIYRNILSLAKPA